jgi:hypothetical protein
LPTAPRTTRRRRSRRANRQGSHCAATDAPTATQCCHTAPPEHNACCPAHAHTTTRHAPPSDSMYTHALCLPPRTRQLVSHGAQSVAAHPAGAHAWAGVPGTAQITPHTAARTRHITSPHLTSPHARMRRTPHHRKPAAPRHNLAHSGARPGPVSTRTTHAPAHEARASSSSPRQAAVNGDSNTTGRVARV